MLIEVMLGAADAAAAAVGILGFVALRTRRPTRVTDLPAAFQALDRSVSANFPGLPGQTWGETFERLREEGVSADWEKIGKILSDYEAYRYGGRPIPVTGREEIVELAMDIQRGIVGTRVKGKGIRSN